MQFYYRETKGFYETDDRGFNTTTGGDFAFSGQMFNDIEERDALFDYISDKLTSEINGLDDIAGMRFNIQAEGMNWRSKVESNRGSEIDRQAKSILDRDKHVIDGLIQGKENVSNYKAVLHATFTLDEQRELGLFTTLANDSGMRPYSPVDENNAAGIAVVKERCRT